MRKLLLFLALLSPIVAYASMGQLPAGGVYFAAAADVTAPTVSTATIGTNGTTLTLAMSETVTRTGGTFDVDCSTAGSNITATYSSGSGSSSLVYTLGTTVNSGDTCNLDYNGAANGIEDAAGNDLAAITDKSITNNSTQGSGPANAPVFVDAAFNGSAGSSSSLSSYNALNVASGTAVPVFVTTIDTTGYKTLTGITDNASNTYSKVGSSYQFAVGSSPTYYFNVEKWLAYNVTGNAALVLDAAYQTVKGAAFISAANYSGAKTSATPYDSGYDPSGTQDATSPYESGSDSTAENKEVIVGYFHSVGGTSQTYSSNGSSTMREQVSTRCIVDRTMDTAGAATFTVASTVSELHYSVAMALKGAE